MPQRKGSSSLPASWTYGPEDPTKWRRSKSASQQELRTLTIKRAIDIMKERERREGYWPRVFRNRAGLYLNHLATGGPLGIPTPDEVKKVVHAAFKQACEETGFTPPNPQPVTKRKKKKR